MSTRPFAYRVALRLYRFYARRGGLGDYAGQHRGACLTTRLTLALRQAPDARCVFP